MKKRRALKIVFLALLVLAVAVAAYVLISNYVKSQPMLQYAYYRGETAAAEYPDARFAVVSDLHVYDTSLGSEGAAFEQTMQSDRKMLLDSEELLDYAIDELLQADLEFVLVSGDLTKDGERVNHEQAAAKLQQLVDHGVQVYVVPGNHDINNPGAVRYDGDTTQPVDTVTAEDFAQIYAAMGYGDAVMRDEDSLSYVAEPMPGLWIVGLDACRYRENQPGGTEIVSGKISQPTLDWLTDVLLQSVEQQKAVIVLMHHGVVEHWKGQAKLHPNYLVQDYQYIGRLLSSYHVKLAFTGHYHALDITGAEFEKGMLYDVETGSLITSPFPFRFCEISAGSLHVRTETMAENLRPGTDFAANAQDFTREMVILEAYNTLRAYKVSEDDAQYIANAVGDGFIAHYRGDEDPAQKTVIDAGKLGLWGRIVYQTQKYVIEGLWDDLPPADNQATLSLQ